MLVYAASFHVHQPSEGPAAIEGMIEAWLLEKWSGLPPLNRLLKLGEFSEKGRHLQIIDAGEPCAGQERLLHMDYQHPDDQEPERRWHIQVGVWHLAGESRTQISVVLETEEIPGVGLPLQLSRPRLVPEIIRRCGLAHEHVRAEVRTLDQGSVSALEEELNAERGHAVILLNAAAGMDLPRLASRLVPLANIYVLPEDGNAAAAIWRRINGDGSGVPEGAQIYYPQGLSQVAPEFSEGVGGQSGVMDLDQRLLRELCRRLARLHRIGEIKRDHVLAHASHLRTRALIEEGARTEAEKDSLIVKLKAELQQREAAFKQMLKKHEEQHDKDLKEYSDLYDKHQALAAENDKMRAELDRLKKIHVRLIEDNKEVHPYTFHPQGDLAEVVQCAAELWSKTLLIKLNSSSDLRGVKFDPLVDVYVALEWLAHEYHQARQKGGGQTHQRLEQGLKKRLSNWFYEPHQSNNALTKYRVDYTCRLDHEEIELREHIGKGKGRKKEESIRILFAWHKRLNKVVVGHISQHPTNSKT